MQEVLEFLKQAGAYYLATNEGGQPHVRPFGTIHLYDGKLYFQTGKVKAVSRQLHADPRLEICAMLAGRWLRVTASAVEDDRREARVSMLEAYPALKGMYDPDDGNTEVWYLRKATATFYSFTEPPRTVTF
ncbi:MAG: pyridoxamine 5'-phosphate oxidase family protein [Oscillospiraceae bacterium]|nr:pyridoxamine 5'-phosphate oxidase family protein [Oscillospiraceae bacterium]